jgi:F-type H+-transporting ATPase subunit epsilon
MAEKIQFELVSPVKLVMASLVDMVVVPGTEGDFGALAQHAPMIATVRPGVVDIHDADKIANRIFVSGGFAEVTEERVTVLAEEAILVSDLTKGMAADRMRSAKEAMADAKSDREKASAERLLAVATAMDAVAH